MDQPRLRRTQRRSETMKVVKLIAELRKLDPELEVMFQGDQEGNYFESIRGVDEDCFWDAENQTVLTESEVEELREEGEEREFPKVAVIYP